MKTYTLEALTDEYVGEKGTPERVQFEVSLKLHLLGDTVKKLRKEKQFTQKQLGELVGVQKAQISKIENAKDVRLSTLIKILSALQAQVNMTIDY